MCLTNLLNGWDNLFICLEVSAAKSNMIEEAVQLK